MKHMCPSQTHDTQSLARVLYTTLRCHEFQHYDPKLQHSDRSLLLMSLMETEANMQQRRHKSTWPLNKYENTLSLAISK